MMRLKSSGKVEVYVGSEHSISFILISHNRSLLLSSSGQRSVLLQGLLRNSGPSGPARRSYLVTIRALMLAASISSSPCHASRIGPSEL